MKNKKEIKTKILLGSGVIASIVIFGIGILFLGKVLIEYIEEIAITVGVLFAFGYASFVIGDILYSRYINKSKEKEEFGLNLKQTSILMKEIERCSKQKRIKKRKKK